MASGIGTPERLARWAIAGVEAGGIKKWFIIVAFIATFPLACTAFVLWLLAYIAKGLNR